MTIARSEVFACVQPVARPRGPSAVTYQQRASVILRVEDSDGAVGWGETYSSPGVVAALGDLGQRLVGQDAASPRRLLGETTRGYPRLAVSAAAIALDDLRGSVLGIPITDLYGGRRRDTVRAYASSGGYLDGVDPESSWPDDVSAALVAGFAACKVRIGRYPRRRELAVLEKLRGDTPAGIDLMVDANGAYTLPIALEVGRELGKLGYRWFEEPLTRFQDGLSYPGYEQLAPALEIPVAAGEGLETRSAFDDFLRRGCADVVQPDAAICGGIDEALFVAELAALHGCLCTPHAWGGAILLAATVQLVGMIPPTAELSDVDFLMLEYDMFENAMRTELLGGQLPLVDGRVAVPRRPGLGVEIDEAWVRRSAKGLVSSHAM